MEIIPEDLVTETWQEVSEFTAERANAEYLQVGGSTAGMGSTKCQQQKAGRKCMPNGEEHRKVPPGREKTAWVRESLEGKFLWATRPYYEYRDSVKY